VSYPSSSLGAIGQIVNLTGKNREFLDLWKILGCHGHLDAAGAKD
jgi:hypothetical protein